MADDKTPANAQPPAKETVVETVEDVTYGDGRYKSLGEFEKGHSELKSTLGKQGTELGNLKGQNELLSKQLLDAQQMVEKNKQPAVAPEEAPDYDSMVAEVTKAYDNGDIDFAEALSKSNAIVAQRVNSTATEAMNTMRDGILNEFQTELSNRDQQVIVDQFNKDNPDFLPLQESGAFEELKAANPMWDDLNAYQHIQMGKAVETAKAENENIVAGSEAAKKTLGKPGTSIQQQNAKPMTNAEMKQSMLDNLG